MVTASSMSLICCCGSVYIIYASFIIVEHQFTNCMASQLLQLLSTIIAVYYLFCIENLLIVLLEKFLPNCFVIAVLLTVLSRQSVPHKT